MVISLLVIDYMLAVGYISNMKSITYKPAARKALRKMPANTAERIMGKIEEYAADPASQANNVKAMKGVAAIRLRVGDWRVIMTEEGEVLDVLDIGPRGGIYS